MLPTIMVSLFQLIQVSHGTNSALDDQTTLRLLHLLLANRNKIGLDYAIEE